MAINFWFIFIGLFVGTLVGLTGLGGGVLMTPLLILSGLSPVVAIGTDIVYAAIAKSFASVLHVKNKNVEYRIVGILLLGSVPGLIVGSFFSRTILENFGEEGLNLILSSILSIILIGLSIVSLFSEISKIITEKILGYQDEVYEEFEALVLQTQETRMENLFLSKQMFSIITAAFAVGMLVQLTSVGSGVLVTIVLLNILPSKRVVGTEILHASILVGLSSILFFNQGFVDFNVLWHITLGAIFGIFVGVRYSKKIPNDLFKIILLFVIMIAGIIVLIEGGH